MEAVGQFFCVALAVIFFLGLMTWHYSRASAILAGWARDNGHQIVSSERCWFCRGPFFWSSKSQEVYYVTVRTCGGEVRRGWVRCGGFFAGMLSDEAEVRWVD